jgi:hypothetical protein
MAIQSPDVNSLLGWVQQYRAVFEPTKTNTILDVVLDVQSELKSERLQESFLSKKGIATLGTIY